MENWLQQEHHVLFSFELQPVHECNPKFQQLYHLFFGKIVPTLEELHKVGFPTRTFLYICGNADGVLERIDLHRFAHIYIVSEVSNCTLHASNMTSISIGQVPLRIRHNLGVFFPQFFPPENDYFAAIQTEHSFQALRESNKSSVAFRKGIYLSPVSRNNHQLEFRLMRCSTNFDGATENFRHTDTEILQLLNKACAQLFALPVQLNHVLAQVYINSVANSGVQKKAVIKAHSDKTKDMPPHAVIAFCTFYSKNPIPSVTPSTADPYDRVFKGKTSVLTRLRFRLKSDVSNALDLPRLFEMQLYPNSVFMMSLATNRLYTHEIVPSVLPVHNIPTRLGYVVRCSKQGAVFRDGQTFLCGKETESPLKPHTEQESEALKAVYLQENKTSQHIVYDEPLCFSLNQGDYMEPVL